jgi:hypothetical protein
MACLLAAFQSFAQKKASNLALVMPFCSAKIIANPDCYDAQLGNLCREYYQGALIALDSLEKAKVSIRVSIYDTENDSMTLLKILQKPQLKEAELIIGPVMQGGNKMMTNFVKGRGVYHVSPLMTFSKTRLEDAYWISANPDLPAYASFLYNYISVLTHDSANVILVSDKSSLDKNINAAIRQIAPTGKMMKIKLLEYEKGIDLVKHLSRTQPNHIIIPSGNESNINSLLRKIKDTTDAFRITCYGFPHWLEFKNADYDVWQRLDMHIVTPFFIDYADERAKAFIAAYRERFFTEPSEAAFKGYDQVLFFATGLDQHGKGFITKMDNKLHPSLHTRFLFKRQKEGSSYQNYFLNVVGLEEMRLKRIN